MSVTIANIVTNLNTYLGDSTEDRISNSERYEAITEATAWLLEELGNEHMISTYEIDFLDTVNYYKVTSPLSDLLIGADLRRGKDDHYISFARKSPREIAEEIGQGARDPSWAIERRDGDIYAVINYEPEQIVTVLTNFDSTTEGGTWTADTSGSDATNITKDSNEYKNGGASLNFDIDVSQSGNDYATIYAADATSRDLSSYEDLGAFLVWAYIPDSTNISSFTLYWGSDTSTTPAGKSNYWSVTVSTDINGNALSDGWNQLKFDWGSATTTGSPDSSAVVYYEFRMTYAGGQGDDTDFRLDYFRLTNPETLTFHYVSWNVGTDSGGNDITAFTATTDIPFFSGRYDQYKYAVAHRAASILFYSGLRLPETGAVEEAEAIKALRRYRKQFESSTVREVKNFKVHGVNLRSRFHRRVPRIN